MKGMLRFCLFFLVSGVFCEGQQLSPLSGQWQPIKLDGPSVLCGQNVSPGTHLPRDLRIWAAFQFKNRLYLWGTQECSGTLSMLLVVSSDNGATWSPLSPPADIGKPLQLGAASNGVYVFGDKGFSITKDASHWSQTIAQSYCDIRRPFLSPLEFETKGLLVQCGYVFLHSVDKGATWTPLPLSPLPIATDPTGPPFINVTGDAIFREASKGTVTHFFRSTDLGVSWEEVGLPNGRAPINVPGAFGGRNLYLLLWDHGTRFAAVSTDHGVSWSLRAIGMELGNYVHPADTLTTIELPDSRVCQSGFDAVRGGVYCSGDAGVTWQWLTKGLPMKDEGYISGTLIQSNSGLFMESGSQAAHADTLWEFVPEP